MRWSKLGASALSSLITVAFTIVAVSVTDWVWISYLHIFLMLWVNCIVYDVFLTLLTRLRRQRD